MTRYLEKQIVKDLQGLPITAEGATAPEDTQGEAVSLHFLRDKDKEVLRV